QNRCLHLQVIERIEKAACGGDHCASCREQRADLRMHGKICITLTRPLLRVRKARVPHASAIHHLLLSERKRPQRLRKQRDFLNPYRHLTGTRAEQHTRHPHMVADVEQVHERKYLIAQFIAAKVQLHAPKLVCQMSKDSLAVSSKRDQSARHSYLRTFLSLAQQSFSCSRVVRSLIRVSEGLHTNLLKRGELVASRTHHEVEVFRFTHDAASPPTVCFRYASMKGSMSPSITR